MHAHVRARVRARAHTHTHGMKAMIIGVAVPTSIDLKQNAKTMLGTETPF